MSDYSSWQPPSFLESDEKRLYSGLRTGDAANQPENSVTEANQLQNGQPQTPKIKWYKKRANYYAIILLLSLIALWSVTLLYVSVLPPEYKSKWTLIIPGSGTGSSLNLDNIGQTSTSVSSAYSTSKVDPKVNYKAIAMSRSVLQSAADLLDISLEEFGRPKIKLIDQTTLLEFTVTGQTAQSALDRSNALNSALQSELTRLRTDELLSRRNGNASVLATYKASADTAQAAVLAYKRDASLVSTQQLDTLSENIEQFKLQKADAQVRAASLTSTVDELQSFLSVSVEEASSAMKLLTDPIFQSLLHVKSEAQAELVERRAVWGSKHPKVKHAQSRVSEATYALLERAARTTGINEDTKLDQLALANDENRSEMFNTLIKTSTEMRSLIIEIEQYDTLIAEMEDKLQDISKRAAELESLETAHQAATAIYISAAAKSDLGQSDIFASYPMTQMLVPPLLPGKPEVLKKVFALVGAAIGSVFIVMSLVVAWKRYVLIQKISKRK